MPQLQVAQGSYYQFGAPATIGDVLKFMVKNSQGGDLILTFDANESNKDITVTVQASADGTTYADVTAAQHKTAVVAQVIKARTRQTFVLRVRPSVDKFLKIRASGGDRAGLTVGFNEILDMQNVQNFLGGGAGT